MNCSPQAPGNGYEEIAQSDNEVMVVIEIVFLSVDLVVAK